MMGNFSELHEELIDLIMKRLSLKDLVSSGGVCKSWQSVVSATIHKNQKLSPWLLLTNDETDVQNLRTFSCLSTKKEEFTIKMPDIHGRRCWGSPFGWLVTFGLDLAIHLLNPLSRARISLPHQSTFKHQYQRQCEPQEMRQKCPRRLLLSSNPSDPSCIVIAICDPCGRLYFARIGDEAWTAIQTSHTWYKDAILFNGQIYAIDTSPFLTVCDISAPNPKGTLIESSPYPERSNEEYLVDVRGELHLLLRHTDYGTDASPNHKFTLSFTVYKFDFQNKIWSEVLDLGDNALFIGSSTSFVLSTLDFPEFTRNAIYCSDDDSGYFRSNFCDMSVYNLGTKTIEPFYFGSDVLSKFSRPLFLIPTLS